MCPHELKELPEAAQASKVVSGKGRASGKESLCMVVAQAKNHHFPNHPFRLVAFFTGVMRCGASLHRDFVQADILDGGPDDRQATRLRREHINLIGALAHITEQTLNRIGRLNVSVHALRKGIKS